MNFGILNAARIGNLAAVSELYLCEQKENRNEDKFFFNIIAIEKPICNYFLLEIIKRKRLYFLVILLLKQGLNLAVILK